MSACSTANRASCSKNFQAAPQGFIFGADGGLAAALAETHVSSIDHNGGKFDDLMIGYGGCQFRCQQC